MMRSKSSFSKLESSGMIVCTSKVLKARTQFSSRHAPARLVNFL